MISYTTCPSPIGTITICTDGSALTGLHIEGDRYFTAIPDDWQYEVNHPVLTQVTQQLQAYFQHKLWDFDLPTKIQGTAFQEAVWKVIKQIPAGKTKTYSEIATLIGKPKAVRAVGTAVGRNPLCIIVPCHRVLPSGKGLGGYVAGLSRKQWLLAHEQSEANNALSI